MTSKIFISYSRKDLEEVRMLRDEIHSLMAQQNHVVNGGNRNA